MTPPTYELINPRLWRVYYAGVPIYDARSTQHHTHANIEEYRDLDAREIRDRVARMSHHRQMQIYDAARKWSA
ncbi:MAG: hypothetical protein Q4P24_12780 [Rhodobacterales bacterium]|nr:hypothetical protein [Rhodobacterales bacterium]